MKLLLDQNLSHKLCGWLADVSPGTEQFRLIGPCRGHGFVQHAIHNDFILVTQDVDFVNLSLLRGHPPKVIWLRCGNQPSRVIEGILRSHAAAIQAFAADPKSGFMELFR